MSYQTNGYLMGLILAAKNDVNHAYHGDAIRYYSKFRALEEHFFNNIHPSVDTGLAIAEERTRSSANRNSGPSNIMTLHGSSHIVDLIKSLDKLTSNLYEKDSRNELDPLEAYLLLCAAHMHDVGNIGGREGHAHRSQELIKDNKELFVSSATRQQVFDIASVHGGRDPDYGKDTLRRINSSNIQRPRLPMLAAILRLGDELSENPDRVPAELAKWHDASEKSQQAYLYARSFEKFEANSDDLHIRFNLYPELYNYTTRMKGKTIGCFDVLEERLNKLELESRYCSQYGRPAFNISKILITILCYDNPLPSTPSRIKNLTLDLERGYPEGLPSLNDRCQELKDGKISFRDYCLGSDGRAKKEGKGLVQRMLFWIRGRTEL